LVCSQEAPKTNMLKKTTCVHLEQLKAAGGLKNYAKIHANLVACVVDRSNELKVCEFLWEIGIII
jgi:hypothetical protein